MRTTLTSLLLHLPHLHAPADDRVLRGILLLRPIGALAQTRKTTKNLRMTTWTTGSTVFAASQQPRIMSPTTFSPSHRQVLRLVLLRNSETLALGNAEERYHRSPAKETAQITAENVLLLQ